MAGKYIAVQRTCDKVEWHRKKNITVVCRHLLHLSKVLISNKYFGWNFRFYLVCWFHGASIGSSVLLDIFMKSDGEELQIRNNNVYHINIKDTFVFQYIRFRMIINIIFLFASLGYQIS